MSEYHVPVMLGEVLEIMDPRPGEVFIDCTLGGGGHALEIARRVTPGGRLIGIDRDDEALEAARQRLADYLEIVTLYQGNFSDLVAIAEELGVRAADGILLDLGVSLRQLDSPDRGFSFRYDSPLDMRMDKSQVLTARDVVNSYSERRLAELIREYGEERWARRIAQFIVDRRSRRPIDTTGDLVEAILAAVPARARSRAIHPARRTFQAIRIEVNRELEALQKGLDAAIGLLSAGGRICVLSYHSLEDRIVKETFLRYAGRCVCPPTLPGCACGARKELEILTRRPVRASDVEVRANPSARSARLRGARKISNQ